MNNTLKIITLISVLFMFGCDAPPCKSPEAIKKAGDAYQSCISMKQQGDGGIGCGRLAYDTYCTK